MSSGAFIKAPGPEFGEAGLAAQGALAARALTKPQSLTQKSVPSS